jgi:DNA modification methylase
MQSTGKVYQLEKSLGQDGKYRPATKTTKATSRPIAEQKARIEALTLIQGDCRNELKKLPAKSVDAIITDPIYPGIAREYGSIGEEDWLTLMKEVVAQCRRVLKPKGSAVFVLQPNYEKMARMRPWLWEFVAWAAREWNLIQDCYWWTTNAMPTCSTQRKIGLMRQSVKWCVWLGQPKCYRNQDAVLWKAAETTLLPKWSDRCLWNSPSGYTVRHGRTAQVAIERGGSTPFNLLPIPSAGADDHHGHPASTPYELASWWCRYILPPSGVLLDPFCGSGTMLAAGLDATASRVIGIDQEKQYLRMAKQRVEKG